MPVYGRLARWLLFCAWFSSTCGQMLKSVLILPFVPTYTWHTAGPLRSHGQAWCAGCTTSTCCGVLCRKPHSNFRFACSEKFQSVEGFSGWFGQKSKVFDKILKASSGGFSCRCTHTPLRRSALMQQTMHVQELACVTWTMGLFKIPYILQRVPLRISLQFLTFCKRCPLGFHWDSLHCARGTP